MYDISPAAMEKAKNLGVNLAEDDEDVCAKSDIILLAVKPQNTAETLAMCKKICQYTTRNASVAQLARAQPCQG